MDLSLFLLELIEKKFLLILEGVGFSSSIASFFSSLWVSILLVIIFLLPTKCLRNPESVPVVLRLVTT